MKNLVIFLIVLTAIAGFEYGQDLTSKSERTDPIHDYGKIVSRKGRIDGHYFLVFSDSTSTEVKFKYYIKYRPTDTIEEKHGLEPR